MERSPKLFINLVDEQLSSKMAKALLWLIIVNLLSNNGATPAGAGGGPRHFI